MSQTTETPVAPRNVLMDKVPPYSTEAEMALLGSMILDNDCIGEVIETLDHEAFYHHTHQVVFQGITVLFSAMKSCDLVTLKDELKKLGKLDEAGGVETLAQLVETVPSAANALHYAGIIREKAVLRSLIRTCTKIIREASVASGEDADRTLDHAQELIFQTAAKEGKEKVQKMGDLLKKTFEQITDIRDRKQRILGLATGFHELDDLISGLQGSQLYIMAGRPSMGKSSLAMRVIESVGVEQKRPVLFFSVEMSNAQIAQQMLCSHCRVPSQKLRSGKLSEEEYQKLVIGAGALNEANIFIDDSPDLTDLELRARARRYKAQHKIELVVVDYLQKMHSKGAENRQQEIARISSSLKSLAKELDIPVVAAAQLNRGTEGREDKKPMLSDLRESGAIEQDADVVMLLYREEYYNPDTERKNIAEINVAKNRTGPTDKLELIFLKDITRFENASAQKGEA